MGSKLTTYKESLKKLKIQSLDDKRESLCLGFAKKCLKNEKVKNMFPIKKSKDQMELRKTNKSKTGKTNIKRFKNLAIPYMRRLLNKEWKERQESEMI